MKITKSIILSFLLIFLACSSKNKGELSSLDENSIFGPDGSLLSESELNSMRDSRYGDGSSLPMAEEGGIFKDINFDYNSSSLGNEAMSNLKYNFKVLQANPNVKVQLEGHCDERGTAEYNMALGAERAKSVQDLLKSYGMNPNRLQVISYGEELPLEMGSSEFSYSKNRRVHFSGYTR